MIVSSTSKGQVSIFIIIGIVILFVFAGILYVTKNNTTSDLEAEAEPLVSQVPQELTPLKIFVDQCLSGVTIQGLRLLGEQGGYIYPEVAGEFSSTDPTNSDGLLLEASKVPYWHYNIQENEGGKVSFASLQPKLTYEEDPQMSVEAQLARFIKEQLNTCLGDYSSFTLQGFTITPTASLEVKARVGEATVNVLLTMPLTVSRGSVNAELETFYVRIPIRLKQYYETAQNLALAERHFSFLEKQAVELISVYSGKDPTKFAPVSDTGFDLFSTISWSELSLQQKFKTLLGTYVPLLRFLGSSNFNYFKYEEGNILAQRVLDNMVLPFSGAENLAISFDYLGWEPYFKTNSEDGIIKPDHLFVNYAVLNFGTQRYDTHYDISYPVLVTIKDETGLDGQEYHFVTALEANVRNNQPAVDGDDFTNVPPKRTTSLACKDEQRDTGILKSIVIDSFSKEPIEDVLVGFSIPHVAECDIGVTDQTGEIKAQYPAAYGGIVNFIHPDYLTNVYPLNTNKYKNKDAIIGYATNDGEEKVIELDKLKEINVVVKKRSLTKCVTPLSCVESGSGCTLSDQICFPQQGLLLQRKALIHTEINGSLLKYHDYYLGGASEDLGLDEEATVTFERVSNIHGQAFVEPYVTSLKVQGKEQGAASLVPGVYKVNIFVVKKSEIVIPEEERCFKYNILFVPQEECFKTKEIKASSFIEGGVVWESKETFLQITPEDLHLSKTLTLFVPLQQLDEVPLTINVGGSATPARVVEDLGVSGTILDLTKEKELHQKLKPKFN